MRIETAGGRQGPELIAHTGSVTRLSTSAPSNPACKLWAIRSILSGKGHRVKLRMRSRNHKRWRLTSASICLLVVVLSYAPLAGAAWSSYQSACCTSKQCPLSEHHHRKAPASPAHDMDCGHEMPGMMACSMSCCQEQSISTTSSAVYILPNATSISALAVPIGSALAENDRESSHVLAPVSPPPKAIQA